MSARYLICLKFITCHDASNICTMQVLVVTTFCAVRARQRKRQDKGTAGMAPTEDGGGPPELAPETAAVLQAATRILVGVALRSAAGDDYGVTAHRPVPL
jgi:hypothetical protein